MIFSVISFFVFSMKKKKEIFEGLVGLFILIIVIFFSYYALQGQKSRFDQKVEYYANFDEIQGVDLGTPVKIHGVDVGSVTYIRLDPKSYQVLVRFSVNKDISLFSDAKVSVMGESLLGKQVVTVDPGSGTLINPGQILYDTYCSSYNLDSLVEKFLFSKKQDKTVNNTPDRG